MATYSYPILPNELLASVARVFRGAGWFRVKRYYDQVPEGQPHWPNTSFSVTWSRTRCIVASGRK